MTVLVVRFVFSVGLIVGAALVLTGYVQVGDGFSAGALAGLGAVAVYAGLERGQAARVVGARWAWHLVCGGLLLTLAVVLAPICVGLAPVYHWPPPNAPVTRWGVLELHTAVLFDIGVGVLVYGSLVGTFGQLFPYIEDEAE